MSTNETSTSVEQIPAWRREGLPGKPAKVVLGKIAWVPVDDLIRDDAGKVILSARHGEAEKLMSEHLGKTIETVEFLPEVIPNGSFASGSLLDMVAFRYMGSGRLSLLERRAVAAFAWLSREYLPPMKIRERVIFPNALEDLPTELRSPRLNVQHWKIFTQDKAIQVAAVIEAMWPDVKTLVFEDGDGWFVAIESGRIEVEDLATFERIETVMWMLSDFDVVENQYSMGTLEAGLSADECEEAKKHLHEKAVRVFDACAGQQRIENSLKEISAKLDVMTAERGGLSAIAKESGKGKRLARATA